MERFISIERVYDKRNVEGLAGARESILVKLTKRVHQIFPDADVKVKPMQANGLNSDASISDREKLPVHPDNILYFAIECCLLEFLNKNGHVLALPEPNHSGAAIMDIVRLRKRPWR